MEQLPYVTGRGSITIGSGVRLSGKPSIGFSSFLPAKPSLSIGDKTFIGHNVGFSIARAVTIGRDCLLASDVQIRDNDGHPINAFKRREGHPCSSETIDPVVIGDDVWIGTGAIVLKGVAIGDRAIVGAHSVVTKNVASDTIVVGNPARVVKSIVAISQIDEANTIGASGCQR